MRNVSVHESAMPEPTTSHANDINTFILFNFIL